MPDAAAFHAKIDEGAFQDALDKRGYAVLPGVLDPDACRTLADRYEADTGFRKRVVMERHGYGRGAYKYFDYPLPAAVAGLRAGLYPQLATAANRWAERLDADGRYPDTLEIYLDRCRRAGQTRATPLLLRYGPGDYNRLHQDLYGAFVFPLQVTVLLSSPGEDFTGGHFVLTEQRPRMQSRAHVAPLERGDAVVFPVRERPVESKRGFARATVRHGVSEIFSGERTTLGVIFHDAA